MGNAQELSFEHVKFETPVRHSRGATGQAVECGVQERGMGWGAYWGVTEMLMVSNKLLRLGEYTPSVRELRTWLLRKGVMGIQLVTGTSPPANRSAAGPI